jgi:hypothetical protein
VEGLCEIVLGEHFVVQKLSEGIKLSASFNVLNDANDTTVICNISSSVVVVGDLKFYFQIPGREHICVPHKQEDTWTISKLKDYKHRIETGELKEAREKKGVVHHLVWDFIEPDHFMFPQLHVEACE